MKKWWSITGASLVLVGMGLYLAYPHTNAMTLNQHQQKVQRVKKFAARLKNKNPHPTSTASPPTGPKIENHKKGPRPEITHTHVLLQVPNGGALAQGFKLTPNAYINHWSWDVVAGSEKRNSSTGVVISYYIQENSGKPTQPITQKIHTIPGAGKISITGYSGSAIDLKSDTGHGTLILNSTGKNGGIVKWDANSK